ncbi:acyltransferase [Curtobacterium flaccumfaciens]|nr:acyltransferase [Curtobacterium flaccumfaciens]
MATTTLTHAPTDAPTSARPQHRTAAPARAGTGAPEAPPPPLTHRAPALDGLRTLAILVVVLYHLHVPQFEGGFIGVTVFFVLSGFLITTLLLGERRRTGRVRLGSFWVKRLLRLYPALLALVVVGLLLWNWVGDYKGASLHSGEAAFIALTYTGNLFRAFWDTSQGVFAHTWSLSMEEQFYLVWPPVLVLLAALRVRRRWLLAGLGVLVVGASAVSWASYRTPSGGTTPDVYFSPVLGVVPLAIGCGLALLLDDEACGCGPPGSWGTWRPGSASCCWSPCCSASATTGPSTRRRSGSCCRRPDWSRRWRSAAWSRSGPPCPRPWAGRRCRGSAAGCRTRRTSGTRW